MAASRGAKLATGREGAGNRRAWASVLPPALAAALLLVGCGAPAASGPPGAAARAGAPRARTVVTIGIEAEIDNLSSKLGGGTNAAEYHFLTNSPLVLLDGQANPSAFLAADLPSQDQGTWVVNPDGTMRTLWKIRPNAQWHDAQPVVAKDFAFALEVYLDPAMPLANRIPEQFMERIESQGDKSLLIYWKQPYPWANRLIARQLEALPEHLLGSLYGAGDPDAFLNHSFWSSPAYVGNGPYRLTQWDPGTQVVYRAFEEFFLGRPPIDEVVFRIIPDSNTLVANLLAGDVDATVGSSFGAVPATTVKERWSQTGEGRLVGTPVRFRHVQIQFNREYLEESALQDVRVRRAIVHAVDRETLAEAVSAGLSPATDIFLPPNDPLHAQAQQVIARYPYDPTRALALLAEAGWTRQADRLMNGLGERFKLDVRTTQGTTNQTEAAIIAADLSRLGMEMTESVVPASRIRDSEYRIKFPGLNTTALSIDNPGTLRRAVGAECPDPARRYSGGNRGCWRNAEFDRLYLVASSSLDVQERGQAVVEALKILTEDVGLFGLSYVPENIAVRKGLTGPGPRWPGQVGTTWNIHQWRWE